MLNIEILKEYINKFQTSERNGVREYIQNLFLSALYRQDDAEKLLFKGGTALRLIHLSPRFSEDLDFTGLGIYHHEEIDNLFLNTLAEIEKVGIEVSYKEAKPTTGGYLGLIHYDAYKQSEDMKFEVSLRKGGTVEGEIYTISSELVPPYTVTQISTKQLVAGKMAALLARKKPRDYYDLYFMLRTQELSRLVDKTKLKTVLDNLKTEKINFKQELFDLLPASHQIIMKNFKDTLKREIAKYV